MGYRHYFYKCKKEDIEVVRYKTWEELLKYVSSRGGETEDNCIDIFDEKFLPQEEVFEFGKLYYEDTDEQIYGTGVPLFSNKEVMERFSDFVPYEVGKQGLLKAIEIYRQKLKDYYEDLLKDGATQILPFGIELPRPDITSADKIKEHIKEKLFWIKYKVNLDETKKILTDSWQYEDTIFNLVFLLKTIDWEKETLLFYGW